MVNERDVQLHGDRVERGKIYVIDFGASRQFELGPGHQPATDLPPTQVPKPQNIKRLDPFSWDVYCLGFVFQTLLKVRPCTCYSEVHTHPVDDSGGIPTVVDLNPGYFVAMPHGLWVTSKGVPLFAVVVPPCAEPL